MSLSELTTQVQLFGRYEAPLGHYDEVCAKPGVLRPHWRRFAEATKQLGREEFARRWQQAQRLLKQNSLAYPDPRNPQARIRPWALDAYPLLLPAAEWQMIASALAQRAVLLDMILRDLYGPQQLLREGLLPAEAVFRHPGYDLPYYGQKPPLDRFLHFYSADLARSPEGQWWVVGDHTEAPSGAGFTLENRIALSRIMPDVFRQCQVERLAPYFIAVREQLARIAPEQRRDPRVVLLTQEAGSPNYFEDAFLARYLGYTLIEAGDLGVRNNQVFLKTLAGLLPVDVLLRRPNSDVCDPLELSDKSAFGVTGLMHAARTGQVAVANTLGSGLVESPVLMAFLPQLCESLLGEKPLMPGVATWWCGDAKSRGFVLSRLEELDVRPAYRRRGADGPLTKELARLSHRELAARIKADPTNFVAQERVARSTAPVWSDNGQERAYVALRTFAVASPTTYRVMPGGLARLSRTLEALDLSLLEGEQSKDTWVLADGPVSPVTLLQTNDTVLPLRRGGIDLPSRVAEDFYWLGRQSERAEALARLLRTVILRLTSEEEGARIVELPLLLRALAERGQIEPGFVVDEIRPRLPAIEVMLPQAVFDDQQLGTLRSTVSRLAHLTSTVRDRLSLDSWRIIRQMDEQFWPGLSEPDLADTLERIDSLLVNLTALTGLVMESMTRTQAWEFLHLGRRLERALQIIGLLRTVLSGDNATDHAVLEALLEVADSIMTYRSRYLSRVQLGPVLDLLLTDETNPRSVAFQIAECVAHVAQLPRDTQATGESLEQRLAASLLETIRTIDSQQLATAYVEGDSELLDWTLLKLEVTLPKLSDAINHKYLIHTGPTQRLAEINPE